MSRWDWTKLLADAVIVDMIEVPCLDQSYKRPVHLSDPVDAGQVDRSKSIFSANAAHGGTLTGQVDRSAPILSEIATPVGSVAGHTLRAVLETGYETLEPGRPPGDMPADRWVQLINDARFFIDHGYAEQAGCLGWSALDLAGCDPVRPYARIDRAGLLLSLNGYRVARLADDHAVIDVGHKDKRMTFPRRDDPDRPLIWQLVPHAVSQRMRSTASTVSTTRGIAEAERGARNIGSSAEGGKAASGRCQ